MNNPLLSDNLLPEFEAILPEHVEPAIDLLLDRCRREMHDRLQQQAEYSWENLVRPLILNEDRLNRVWSAIEHLHSVADSKALREAYNRCLPKLTEYASETGQNKDLYHAYKQIAVQPDFQGLAPAQQKTIDNALRDFTLSGVGLEPDKQHRFREIQQDLSRQQTKFEENLLDATQAWRINITDEKRLSGIPDTVLSLAKKTAGDRGEPGWTFTLDAPSAIPVLKYADDGRLRRDVYEAYVTRASDTGPNAGHYDNSDIMVEILSLRKELAGLLGFENYTGYSLARKMAETPEEVFQFLQDLAVHSHPVASAEIDALKDFAGKHYQIEDIPAWDLAYYSEKYRQQLYSFSQEDLRPYFPVTRVLAGLFTIVNRLYGISIREQEGVSVWDPEVRFYEIFDASETLRGGFFLDLYARPSKRGGAWMGDCVDRCMDGDILQPPIAFVNCNFTPPVGNDPTLLTHDEVLTLFHEFGHGLHHLLTQVDHPPVAGINGVPWDAVELPSQFMENWCWQRDAVNLISGHYRTGEVLPDTLFQSMCNARNFQAGMQMVRQLEFALFDFHLHHGQVPSTPDEIQQVLDSVRREVAVVSPPAFNRFQNGFAHIFAGGYAAGYYSYKWAEVLSADAFSLFEENGIFDRQSGRHFMQTFLEQGGAREPMELFVEFRGRKPSIEPLLRHSGIIPQTDGIIQYDH